MCRPSASGDHWSSAAPSSLTLPRTGVQTPTSIRASEDFPDRADHAKRLAGGEREIHVLANDFVLARRTDRRILHDEDLNRRLERHRIGPRRQVSEQSRQAMPALPCTHEAAPT